MGAKTHSDITSAFAIAGPSAEFPKVSSIATASARHDLDGHRGLDVFHAQHPCTVLLDANGPLRSAILALFLWPHHHVAAAVVPRSQSLRSQRFKGAVLARGRSHHCLDVLVFGFAANYLGRHDGHRFYGADFHHDWRRMVSW